MTTEAEAGAKATEANGTGAMAAAVTGGEAGAAAVMGPGMVVGLGDPNPWENLHLWRICWRYTEKSDAEHLYI